MVHIKTVPGRIFIRRTKLNFRMYNVTSFNIIFNCLQSIDDGYIQTKGQL